MYLKDAQLADTGIYSDVDIEKVICAANARTHDEQQKLKDGESRLIRSEGISRPIPRSKGSVQVKIARKKQAAQRQKKNLDGICEVAAPRSIGGKMNSTTSVIKEANRPEVCVPNSDIAKFGMRNESLGNRAWSEH